MRSTIWVAAIVPTPYDGRPKWQYATTFETLKVAREWLDDERYPLVAGRRLPCRKRIDRFDKAGSVVGRPARYLSR